MAMEILSSAKQRSFMACNRTGRRKNLILNLRDTTCWIHVSLVLWYPAIPLSLPFDTSHAASVVTILATMDMEILWLSWVVFCWKKETEYLHQASSATLGCTSVGRAVSWSCHGVGGCPGCTQIRERADLSKGCGAALRVGVSPLPCCLGASTEV